MNGLRSWFAGRQRTAKPRRTHGGVPPEIACRLISEDKGRALYRYLRAYGKGRPGVTQEREEWWIVRDELGRVVGGAMVGLIGDEHPVSIDVAIDPARQREGWATPTL